MALTGGPTVTLTFKGDTDNLRREIAGIGTMVAGVGATVGILGGVGAAASAAVLAIAAVPLAFAAIGVAAVASSDRSKAAFTGLKDHVLASVRELAAPIQEELIRSINSVQAAYDRIAPTLGRLFELAAPQLRAFTSGILALVENALPGFETAMRNSGPVVDAFARGLGTLGTGIGNFFAELSKGTPGAVTGLDALFGLTRDLLEWLGRLAGQLANVLGPAFADMTGPVMDIVGAMGDALMPIVQAIAPLLGTVASVLRDVLVPMFQALAPPIAAVVTALVQELRPILIDIGEWFTRNSAQIKDVAEKLGVLLVEAIHAVGPLVAELVRAALELVQALLPVIPPLVEMARNAMPLVAGVIKDVLIPIIKWLVTEFVGLIDYGVKIAEEFARLSVRWRTYWEEIKAAFADAGAKITAGIEAFSALPETARKYWDQMYQAIKDKIAVIITDIVAFPGKLLDAILAPVKKFYDAGATLMQSVANGITSKADAATGATASALQGPAGMFPKSPAKEGPFSGSGYTFDRGVKMMEDFGRGITEAAPKLAQLARAAMEGAHIAMSGFTSPGSGGSISGSAPGLGSIDLKVAPGVDSALSSLLMNLVRTGQLQLQRAGL